jgi:hypothetical protein
MDSGEGKKPKTELRGEGKGVFKLFRRGWNGKFTTHDRHKIQILLSPNIVLVCGNKRAVSNESARERKQRGRAHRVTAVCGK